jgi:hypothetical protein
MSLVPCKRKRKIQTQKHSMRLQNDEDYLEHSYSLVTLECRFSQHDGYCSDPEDNSKSQRLVLVQDIQSPKMPIAFPKDITNLIMSYHLQNFTFATTWTVCGGYECGTKDSFIRVVSAHKISAEHAKMMIRRKRRAFPHNLPLPRFNFVTFVLVFLQDVSPLISEDDIA